MNRFSSSILDSRVSVKKWDICFLPSKDTGHFAIQMKEAAVTLLSGSIGVI
jgi:hypothetical protein